MTFTGLPGYYAIYYLFLLFVIFLLRRKLQMGFRDLVLVLAITALIGIILPFSLSLIGVWWTLTLVVVTALTVISAVIAVRIKEDRELEGQLEQVLRPPVSILPVRDERSQEEEAEEQPPEIPAATVPTEAEQLASRLETLKKEAEISESEMLQPSESEAARVDNELAAVEDQRSFDSELAVTVPEMEEPEQPEEPVPIETNVEVSLEGESDDPETSEVTDEADVLTPIQPDEASEDEPDQTETAELTAVEEELVASLELPEEEPETADEPAADEMAEHETDQPPEAVAAESEHTEDTAQREDEPEELIAEEPTEREPERSEEISDHERLAANLPRQNLSLVQQHYGAATEALQKRDYPLALNELKQALSFEPPMMARRMITRDYVRILNEMGLYQQSILALRNLLNQLPAEAEKIKMEIEGNIKYIEIIVYLLQKYNKNNLPWSLVSPELRKQADDQYSRIHKQQATGNE